MSGMVKKGYMMHLVFAILCALVVFTGGVTFGVIMGILVYAAYIMLMYAEGCGRGEHACSVRDIITKLEKDGKKADVKLAKETYSVKTAVKAALTISVPFVLLAVANLIFANSASTSESYLGIASRVLFMPAAFITRLCVHFVKYNTDAVQKVAATVIGAFDYGSVDINAILAGTANIGTYAKAIDLTPLTVMRICYIPAVIMPALAMLLGYLRGPKLREKTLAEMMKGTSKKRKKLKVFSKPKKARQARPEI